MASCEKSRTTTLRRSQLNFVLTYRFCEYSPLHLDQNWPAWCSTPFERIDLEAQIFLRKGLDDGSSVLATWKVSVGGVLPNRKEWSWWALTRAETSDTKITRSSCVNFCPFVSSSMEGQDTSNRADFSFSHSHEMGRVGLIELPGTSLIRQVLCDCLMVHLSHWII